MLDVFIFLNTLFFLFPILKDLPSPSKLLSYEIPQTTKIFDRNGTLLYYIYTDQAFAFASEIKALLEIVETQPKVDEHALADYGRYGFCLGTDTLFRGIHRLEQGHALVFNPRAWRLAQPPFLKFPY